MSLLILQIINNYRFQIVTQTSTFQVDANGKLIIPEYATLVQLDIDPYVASLVYDTTATNTGRWGGVVRLLQERLGGNALLCCSCRR